MSEEPRWRSAPFFPPADVYRASASDTFMQYSTCSAADFLHPDFAGICAELQIGEGYHRKLWEWAYIIHHARTTSRVGQGKRALGFGVGTERLPAIFAKAGSSVTATDAPPDIAVSSGWQDGNQFSQQLETLPRLGMSNDQFEKFVEFRSCDMNAIDEDLQGYDFCWSSCCLEHLGTLQKGLDFIINSVEKTLKVGGVACHTTEFNCSSNTKTVESGWTVIYRRRDLEGLIDELRARGHKVDAFRIAPDRYTQDSFVDVPPYLHSPHLKLELEGHVATSVGVMIERGA